MRATKVTAVIQDQGERGTRVQEDKSIVLSKHSGTLRKQQQSQMKRKGQQIILFR